MKNIHILSTDKPSRLCINGKNGQHIYITSNEEIKEGDWIFNEEREPSVLQCIGQGSLRGWKKIILTTDQDLIKDGVQEISDEFLEWFVKNPKCNWVEVNDWLDDEGVIAFNGQTRFQIITPKEEPKQETLEEAAENTTKKYINEREKQTAYLEFIEGAKWQAERMCNHTYILISEQAHRVIKCQKCDNTQPI